MDNSNFNRNDIIADVQQELEYKLNEFFDNFDAAGRDSSGVPTITQIETIMNKLEHETRKTFLSMLSKRINNIDESELIESKKDSMQDRG